MQGTALVNRNPKERACDIGYFLFTSGTGVTVLDFGFTDDGECRRRVCRLEKTGQLAVAVVYFYDRHLPDLYHRFSLFNAFRTVRRLQRLKKYESGKQTDVTFPQGEE